MKPSTTRSAKARWVNLATLTAAALTWIVALDDPPPAQASPQADPPLTLLAFNDLGMHCMNHNFGNLCILPPFNNLHAQLILRGQSPQLIDEHASVQYMFPENTVSSTKTNFWDYVDQLFGVALPPDVGLTGNGMAGPMARGVDQDWVATGIPITPLLDDGSLQPYNLATVTATYNGMQAMTKTVVPVSWEIKCDYCHGLQTATPRQKRSGETLEQRTEWDILRKHDRMHGTNLMNQRPVLCAKCHADPALGTPGEPGVPNMSSAMHMSHATRVERLPLQNKCYACHPGVQTQCQRDIHIQRGVTCTNCHGGMQSVGDPGRQPWVDEPKCGSCHAVPGHGYEEPGRLFKNSRGHGNILCATCHNSPHAITPTTNPEDNVQAVMHQGEPGVIKKCTVCHTQTPTDPFPHRRDD